MHQKRLCAATEVPNPPTYREVRWGGAPAPDGALPPATEVRLRCWQLPQAPAQPSTIDVPAAGSCACPNGSNPAPPLWRDCAARVPRGGSQAPLAALHADEGPPGTGSGRARRYVPLTNARAPSRTSRARPGRGAPVALAAGERRGRLVRRGPHDRARVRDQASRRTAGHDAKPTHLSPGLQSSVA